MVKNYIGIEFNRSHLENIYEVQLFSSFNNYLDTIDMAVLFINMFLLLLICSYFLYKKINSPKKRKVKMDVINRNNEIPYFITLKHHKKGKSRDPSIKQKQFKDQPQLQLRCQKCKFVTQIAQKNLITHQ